MLSCSHTGTQIHDGQVEDRVVVRCCGRPRPHDSRKRRSWIEHGPMHVPSFFSILAFSIYTKLPVVARKIVHPAIAPKPHSPRKAVGLAQDPAHDDVANPEQQNVT
jgi:hypothetical protein